MSSLKKEFLKTSLIGFLIAFLIIFLLYEVITKIVIKEKVLQARNIATTIIYYRHYLANISSDVKIINPHISPFALTPAYVTDQVAKNLRKNKFYIKQVSENYRNPMDKPKPFELKAIEFFKTHKDKKEYYKVYPPDKYFSEKHVFYARRLVIEKSCLRCHGVPYKDVPAPLYKKIVKIYGNKAFNYHLGYIRGIISIVFPYEKVLREAGIIFGIIISIGLIFFLIGLFIFFKLHKNIVLDIQKVLNHFKSIENNNFPIFKEKMKFLEFDILKNQINTTFKILKQYRRESLKKYYLNSLTDLPNRNKFLEIINKNKYIIVLLNIDKFKEINFYFGNEIGDLLIKEVANRLKKLKKIFKFKLYHIDIDEFALLFTDMPKEELTKIIKNILEELEKPYKIKDNEIIVRFRAGISFEQKDYLRADVALDVAKEEKKDIVFGKEVESLSKYKEHLQWLKKLKSALENDRIVPFYQPIVDKNKNIIKYEALVRMIDEDGKVISPFFFLDVARKSRLYLQITKRVIEKSMEKIKEKNCAISINLTLEDINDEEMRKFIFEHIKQISNKKLLTFEIVENEDVGENENVKQFLMKIKELGSLIYIDDFGSGYANFDYLIKLNPDGVKIDGSIVKNILTDKNSEIILKTIVSFAKEMNIKTIAEFVENEEIFNKLIEFGVDYFQGYYFSPPKPDIE